jgi:GNAT superfamily N-acetyltransferase
MYKFELLTLNELKPLLLDTYEKLQAPIFKTLSHPLDLSNPAYDSLFAIGASLDGVPVGLLLALLSREARGGEIISLFVDEAHRRQKIATRMVEKTIHLLREAKLIRLTMTYPDRRPITPVIEQFLTSVGFKDKYLVMAEFQFDSFRFNPPWLSQQYSLPEGFEIFPWGELTYDECQQIKFGYRHQSIPATVYPFAEDGDFDPLNSLGLRFQGKLIGWVVTKRLDPDTICYQSIFIEQELHKRGMIIQLLMESIRIHIKHKVKWGIFRVNVLQSSGRWLHFIRRRLAPYADFIDEYYQSWFPLKSPVDKSTP